MDGLNYRWFSVELSGNSSTLRVLFSVVLLRHSLLNFYNLNHPDFLDRPSSTMDFPRLSGYHVFSQIDKCCVSGLIS